MEASVRSHRRVVVRFGIFELDLQTHELYKRGHRVKLQDQPFQVLAMLLERPGELVTRDELHQRLWPGETVASMDDGLNAAIRRLRFALNDSAGRAKYIETLPRRGYRFIAPVERVGPFEESDEDRDRYGEGHSAEIRLVPGGAADPRAYHRTLAFVLAAMLVVAVAATVSLTRRPAAPPPAGQTAQGSLQPRFIHLTKAAGVEAHPAVSPDGRFVAYVSSELGNDDIHLQRIGSDSSVNLTRGSAAHDSQPAFSPDGRQIAFRSERDGGGIFTMTVDGGSLRRVSDFGFDPAWAPDGRSLVVATEGVFNPLSRTSISALWTIDLASGAKSMIFEGDAIQPAWSPDGKRIAFWRTSGNAGKRDIATIPAGGGALRLVTDDAAIDWSPSWSADGSHLYFASDRGGSMNLWRIAVGAEGEPVGDPEAVTAPARWSGDLSVGGAGAIAFTAADPRSNIHRVAFDPGRNAVAGAPVPVTHATLSLIQPAVSPDGTWVAYRTEIEQEDIYLTRSDGSGGEIRLTDDAANDRAPSWSRDGKWIYFYSDRSGKYEAWAVRPDGTGLRQITALPVDPLFFPLAFPDGSRIAANTPGGSFIMPLREDGPAKTPEDLPPYPEPGLAFRASSVAADGRWLAGTLYSSAGLRVPSIVVYSLEDRRYQVVARRGSWPAFLSDGRRLVFADGNALVIADRISGTVREILTVEGEIPFGVSASPDDRTLYFALATRESDIWVAKLR